MPGIALRESSADSAASCDHLPMPNEPDPNVPSPRFAAACLVLGTLDTDQVPWWAAHWLADGHDGPMLRQLAGLGVQDPQVHDLLPAALEELAVPLPTEVAASATVVFDDLARRFLASELHERWVSQQVEDVITRAEYSQQVIDLPLGRIYGLAGERTSGYKPGPGLRDDVRAACLSQLGLRASS